MLRIMQRSGVVHVSHLLFLEISFGSSLFWETNLIMLWTEMVMVCDPLIRFFIVSGNTEQRKDFSTEE